MASASRAHDDRQRRRAWEARWSAGTRYALAAQRAHLWGPLAGVACPAQPARVRCSSGSEGGLRLARRTFLAAHAL